jgi:hypothetical protein
MRQRILATTLLFAIMYHPGQAGAQGRGATPPQPRQSSPAAPPATNRGPLTLPQLIEALDCVATKCSPRLSKMGDVEQMVAQRGVDFQGDPVRLDILKQFGATPKLIGLIPPTPSAAPAKVAGPLTVICEPKDCAVIVNETYHGLTEQGRKTITGLQPGDAKVQIFSDGYEGMSRNVQLQESAPTTEMFTLQIPDVVRQRVGKEFLFDAVSALGGIDGLMQVGDLEGSGVLRWLDNEGKPQQWDMSFTKHPANELTMNFKNRDGQCSATISGDTSKNECRGRLKNSAEKVAEQAATLFRSYQVQSVIQALMKRTVSVSESDTSRLETSGGNDSYALTVGKESLPIELVYAPPNGRAPVKVQYSNYASVGAGRFPGRIAIGQVDQEPVMIFTLSNPPSRPRSR